MSFFPRASAVFRLACYCHENMHAPLLDVALAEPVETGDADGKDAAKEDCTGGTLEGEVTLVLEGLVAPWRGHVPAWRVSVGRGKGGEGATHCLNPWDIVVWDVEMDMEWTDE